MPGVTGGTNAATLTQVDAASVAAAAGYDAVIVMAGTDQSVSSEDRDRTSLALPGAQAQMISQIEAVNPNTVVYLQTVGNVDLAPFRSTSPALLWSSYNGQRQGEALADVLFGTVNPSGHLPFTWYRDDSQLPPITDYHIRPSATSPGRTYQYFTGREARAAVCTRSRYAEDRLAAGAFTQYVILGAGLDSFAWRRPDLLGRLTVFEVDHPSSQAWKLERVADLGLPISALQVFVPVDFEAEPVEDALGAAGFDWAQPAMFCWTGVAPYLSAQAIESTLHTIAAASPGSELRV